MSRSQPARAAVPAAKKPKPEQKGPSKLLQAGMVGLLALTATVAIFLLSGLSLAKVEVGNLTAGPLLARKQLQTDIATAASNHRLQLTYPDGTTKAFALANLGIAVDGEASAKAAVAAQKTAPWLQRLQWWHSIPVPLTLKVNNAMLVDFINNQATITVTPAQDATLAIEDGATKIIEEAVGDGYTIKNAKNTIVQAVAGLKSQPLALTPGNIPPKLLSQNLGPTKKTVDTILKQPVKFNLAGRDIVASPTTIGSWIDLAPDPSTKTVNATVNGNKVFAYINSITKSYASSYRSRIIMTQADGTSVTLVPGFDGLETENKPVVTDNLANAIKAGNGVAIKLAVQYTPARAPSYSFDKWLAVDVTAKRMYAYEKTNVVRTFLISAGAPGTPTTLGVHKIYSKLRRQDMRGPNADGTSYFQPNVEWVNYFHGGEAIHGNYWRPLSYFGSVNSSHGCVGILNPDAEWLYSWAPIGTLVVTYN